MFRKALSYVVVEIVSVAGGSGGSISLMVLILVKSREKPTDSVSDLNLTTRKIGCLLSKS